MTAFGGGLAAACAPNGVMALGGGLTAGLPTALPGGDAALGILLADDDFSAGGDLALGPAEDARGDFKGKALFLAAPWEVDLPFRLALELDVVVTSGLAPLAR